MCPAPDLQIALSNQQSDKSNALTLSATGSGDLAEFTSNLQPQRASFGYVRVKYANDDHSFREKFCLVIWIGEEVKIMRRAKVSLQRGSVVRGTWVWTGRDPDTYLWQS